MPELALGIRRPGTQSTAYDGKRALAKSVIGQRLVRMGVTLTDLTDEQLASVALSRAAAYKELALIYQDLADRNDTVSMEKSRHYSSLYEDSWSDIIIELGISPAAASLTTIPCYRS